MAMEISIRPCRPDECGSILELWRDADSVPSVTDSVDALEQVLQADGDLLLVAEFQGRIIGTVMGGWDGWRGNIYRLAVLPEYRLHGIGRKLVMEVERKLAAKGVRKISILVAKSEDMAIDFWDSMKKNNYRPDERIIRYAKSI